MNRNNTYQLHTPITHGFYMAVVLLLAILFTGCKQEPYTPPSYRLIDLLNDELNEAIIQDGFSPPVASRIYAYCNLAAFEANQLGKEGNVDLTSILNEYNPQLPSLPANADQNLIIASAFCHTARKLVYRDFIIDSLLSRCIREYSQTDRRSVRQKSLQSGEAIADQIIAYAKEDLYDQTRSSPLYTLLKTPGSWEPTPPTYGTPVEPYWGSLRTFVIEPEDSILVAQHVAFDSVPGSPFYDLNHHVYEQANQATEDDKRLAMHWDGDPMPPKRLKHINLIKRQLNPVGHWLAMAKTLSNHLAFTDDQALEVYLRISLACADAMINCWGHKYDINLVRPQTYINEYIDENWDPVLVTPLFPEYPSGHSVIGGSCAGIMIDIFSDTIPFADSTQLRFGHKTRYFESISHAAKECADSRVVGGVHFIPAVEEGLALGNRIGEIHIEAFNSLSP